MRAHAVVVHGAGDVRIEERDVAPPGDGEVQIDVSLGGSAAPTLATTNTARSALTP